MVEKEKSSRLKTKSIAGLALILAGNGIGIASKHYTGDEFAVPKAVYDFVLQDGCSTKVGQSEINETSTLILANNDSKASDLHQGTELSGDEFKDYARRNAEINGLTLIDESSYVTQLIQNETLEEVLETVNSYTQNYGFSVSVPEEINLMEFVKAIPFEEINLEVLKRKLSYLLNELYYVPVDIRSVSPLKEVKIVKVVYEDILGLNSEGIGATYNNISNNVYIGLGSISNTLHNSTFFHEFYHGIDTTLCTYFGSSNDMDFNKVSAESNKPLREQKAALAANTIFPYSRISNDSISEESHDGLTLLISRIDYAIPGYAQYWTSLKLDAKNNKE